MIDNTPIDDSRTDGSRSRRVQYDGSGSIATTIVLAIAEIDDADPTEMEPLYGSVDPELLNSLVNDDRGISGDVMFTYRGYRVTVDSDGGIVVTPASDPGRDST